MMSSMKLDKGEDFRGRTVNLNKIENGSLLQSIRDYASYVPQAVSGLSSLLPKSATQPAPEPEENVDKKEKITWAKFDHTVGSGDREQVVLMIGYHNGVQLYELQETEEGMRVLELYSKRDGAVHCARIIGNPVNPDPETSPFHNARPILATVSAEDNAHAPRSAIRFYSLREQRNVHMLRFQSDVLGIESNSLVIAAALKESIYVFNANTLEKVFAVQTFPCQTGIGVLALGPRWLAYAGNEPIKGPSASSQESLTSTALGVAKNIGNGLYHLGDIGYRRISTYLNGDGTPMPQPKSAAHANDGLSEYAGSLVVRDVVTGAVVSHFQAHPSPLTFISFDPTGSLVVTASTVGNHINIFKIKPSSSPQDFTYRHIYKLVRGVTQAMIREAKFTLDSRWVCVGTSHGTAHIYAINPWGGPVSGHTHLPSLTSHEQSLFYPYVPGERDALSETTVTLSVMTRIKSWRAWFGMPTGEDGTLAPTTVAPHFLSHGRLLVMNGDGALTLYSLTGTASEPDKQLTVSAAPTATNEVVRMSSWSEAQTILFQGAGQCKLSHYSHEAVVATAPSAPAPSAGNTVKGAKNASPTPNGNPSGKDKGKGNGSRRITKSPEPKASAPSSPDLASASQAVWLSNVEINTHEPARPPVWARSNITFKAHGGEGLSGLRKSELMKSSIGRYLTSEVLESRAVEINKFGDQDSERECSVLSSSPADSMEGLRDHIKCAMSTPLSAELRKRPGMDPDVQRASSPPPAVRDNFVDDKREYFTRSQDDDDNDGGGSGDDGEGSGDDDNTGDNDELYEEDFHEEEEEEDEKEENDAEDDENNEGEEPPEEPEEEPMPEPVWTPAPSKRNRRRR